MNALRRPTVWAAIISVVVAIGALAVIIAGQGEPHASPEVTAGSSPTASQAATGAQATLASTATRASQATRTSTPRPSQTPTFAQPPTGTASTASAATAVPGVSPTIAVIAETQSGPGVSRSFDLPDGLYRVSFRADAGFELVLPIVEQGDCGSEPLFDGAPGKFAGSATYHSTGCRIHFEIDGAGGGWALDVETIASGASTTAPFSLAGNSPQTSEVVDLPVGTYVVAVDSQGPSMVVTPLVVDGECLERPIIVTTAPGSYQAIYASNGCLIVFQVSFAAGPWTLSVKARP